EPRTGFRPVARCCRYWQRPARGAVAPAPAGQQPAAARAPGGGDPPQRRALPAAGHPHRQAHSHQV
ncbi:MAG: hypothetical protein AVDCRST_MAG51-3364, partial [uncultured Ramlibacter sp.]